MDFDLSKAILNYVLRLRLPLILVLNLTLASISLFCSLLLRFDFDTSIILRADYLLMPLLLLMTFRTGAYIQFKLNQGFWRYASTYDLIRILKAHAVSSLLFTATTLMLRLEFPRAVIIIELALSILLAGGSRLLVRLWCEAFFSGIEGDRREVIVLGAGDSGHLLVRNLLQQSKLPYLPVCLLDDAERLQNGSVYGVPIEGPLSDLSHRLRMMPRVAAVIVAIPSLSLERFEEIEETCNSFDVPLKKLQAFEDIACLDAELHLGPLSVESVLEKESEIEYELDIKNVLAGSSVLITGAGGSIGSELVRQVLNFEPKKLIMLDSGEFNLFNIEREICRKHPDVEKHAVLADIRDENRILKIFRQHKPQFVFHAAAYKHVPLIEANPCEAFNNNVLGTRNLLRVARHTGVEKIVLISTDKAVDPSSLMGCSKRIAELLVRAESERANGHAMSTAIVRFGNVINSTGSVVPLFKEQILSGGPITVTHPEMERFFMSIKEAVRLVLTAGTLGKAAEVYVLDMGEPVKVVDVAKKMRALYGRRDVPIIYTGIRPGEKLKEDLVARGEATQSTLFRKVRKLSSPDTDTIDIARAVAEIEDRIHLLSSEEIGQLMRELINRSIEEQEATVRVAGG